MSSDRSIDPEKRSDPYLDLTPEQIAIEQAVRTEWIDASDAAMKIEQAGRRAADEALEAEMAPLRAAFAAAEADARVRAAARHVEADLEFGRAIAIVDEAYNAASPLVARKEALKPWLSR
jgi:hypothetical protein